MNATVLSPRQVMERSMVRHLIRTAKVHGYAVVKVDDGEEVHKATESDALLAALTRLSNAVAEGEAALTLLKDYRFTGEPTSVQRRFSDEHAIFGSHAK